MPTTTGLAGDAAVTGALALADELDAYLERHVVAPRLPAAIDRDGWGFHSRFDEAWRPLREPTRFLVHQARIAWTASLLLARRPRHAGTASEVARHGLVALERMRDRATGLYRTRVRLDGESEPSGAGFHLYDQAFALFALAGLARAPGLDEAARAAERAGELFERIETRLRRPQGGYRRSVAGDGTPLVHDSRAVVPASDGLWGPSGWLDANSHLHLVEAYAELRRADPGGAAHPGLAPALEALLELFFERFWAAPGCLHLQLDEELRPVPGAVSYGHDIEAAELLLDAADALGGPPRPRLLERAGRLAEHALALGWDPHLETWTERGNALGRSADLACGWWVAFEALHTCSSFARRFPERRALYERAWHDTWKFVRRRLTDEEGVGVWQGFDARGHLVRAKSGDWFATYHAARALVASADRLRGAAR